MSDSFNDRLSQMIDWQPPAGWRRIDTIDAHTAGEPLRIILSGWPELSGATILERRREAKKKWDSLRTTLMWEPRGHADMYGCLIVPPTTQDGDFGVLFLHNEGFSTMCGHGIIAVTKTAVETGLVEAKEPKTEIRIDTPAGRVTSYAHLKDGVVQEVRFHNVPSFVSALDQKIEVPGLGLVRYDIAFGGAYYAYVEAGSVSVGMASGDFRDLIDKGVAIKKAVMESHQIEHPIDPDLGFLYGTIFIGPPEDLSHHSRNVCIFAEGEVDRSPTGTGVSGRLALHHARGEISLDETITIESILGSCFTGRVVKKTTCGPHAAIIPEVGGTSHLCGINTWYIDPADPLGKGFILR